MLAELQEANIGEDHRQDRSEDRREDHRRDNNEDGVQDNSEGHSKKSGQDRIPDCLMSLRAMTTMRTPW